MALCTGSIRRSCRHNKFEVAVVGQTSSAKIKRGIASLIRDCCHDAKLLELYTISSGKILDDADSWLEVLAVSPLELAARVEALAAK